jgi:hypothetical protein
MLPTPLQIEDASLTVECQVISQAPLFGFLVWYEVLGFKASKMPWQLFVSTVVKIAFAANDMDVGLGRDALPVVGFGWLEGFNKGYGFNPPIYTMLLRGVRNIRYVGDILKSVAPGPSGQIVILLQCHADSMASDSGVLKHEKHDEVVKLARNQHREHGCQRMKVAVNLHRSLTKVALAGCTGCI